MGGEYCFQWIEGGCLDESKSYYTDCLTDAKETRQAVLSLAKGTLRGIEQQQSGLVATGPITRGDVNTLRKHMEALAENMPEALSLYQQLGLRMVTLTLNKGSISNKQANDMENVLRFPSSENGPINTNK